MSDNPAVHRDLYNLCCDKLIGQGVTRQVWSSKLLPNSVIKVEGYASDTAFQNVIEWETWHRVKNTVHAKWFAPCEWISPNGIILIMAKTETPQKSQYPVQLPVYLSDTKYTNYGLYKDQFVCHDYGTNMLFERGFSKRMRTAEWWEG